MVSKTERGTPLRLPSHRGVRCMGELGKWESEMKGRVGKVERDMKRKSVEKCRCLG